MNRHFVFDDDDNLKEVRGYDANDLCIERYEIVYDENDKVVGIRPLDPAEMIPQTFIDKFKKLWKKQKPFSQILSVDFIGLIQYIGTINKIKNIKNIETIEDIENIVNLESLDLIDLITKVSEVTLIKSIERINSAYIQNVPHFINPDFEVWETSVKPLGFQVAIGIQKSTIPFSGLASCEFKQGATSYVKQFLEIPIECKYIRRLSVVAFADGDGWIDSNIRVIAYYTDGTSTTHNFTVTFDFAWHECDMTPYLDSSKIFNGLLIQETTTERTYADSLVMLSSEPRVITGIKGLEGRCYRRTGNLAFNTEEILYDISGKAVTIQSLVFSANHATYAQLFIKPYKADGSLDANFGMILRDGSAYNVISPISLNVHKSEIWEELIYDAGNNYYKFGLLRRMSFSNGVKISVKNASTDTAYDIGCQSVVSIEGE